ncbi:hypothetical protein L873DRAFT_278934 [Choiromyces venosus 120613-1]|uniref:Uncharacterized protein n=1 Tax=Choiromyces venosus 120613-1 TaxID=1336337 RepID=A0A3N4KB01_9PEZI|nr:hypothetical protein L873DRAFT_278934 [Choiromyces venosus 120613-1]
MSLLFSFFITIHSNDGELEEAVVLLPPVSTCAMVVSAILFGRSHFSLLDTCSKDLEYFKTIVSGLKQHHIRWLTVQHLSYCNAFPSFLAWVNAFQDEAFSLANCMWSVEYRVKSTSYSIDGKMTALSNPRTFCLGPKTFPNCQKPTLTAELVSLAVAFAADLDGPPIMVACEYDGAGGTKFFLSFSKFFKRVPSFAYRQ